MHAVVARGRGLQQEVNEVAHVIDAPLGRDGRIVLHIGRGRHMESLVFDAQQVARDRVLDERLALHDVVTVAHARSLIFGRVLEALHRVVELVERRGEHCALLGDRRDAAASGAVFERLRLVHVHKGTWRELRRLRRLRHFLSALSTFSAYLERLIPLDLHDRAIVGQGGAVGRQRTLLRPLEELLTRGGGSRYPAGFCHALDLQLMAGALLDVDRFLGPVLHDRIDEVHVVQVEQARPWLVSWV